MGDYYLSIQGHVLPEFGPEPTQVVTNGTCNVSKTPSISIIGRSGSKKPTIYGKVN